MTFAAIIIILSLVNCAQSYALCALLVVSGKGDKRANRALALMLFFMSNAVLIHVFHYAYEERIPWAMPFPTPFPRFTDILSHLLVVQILLFAPLMALYVRIVTGCKVIPFRRLAIEGLPAVFFLILAFKELLPGVRADEPDHPGLSILYWIVVVSLIGYLIVSFRLFGRFSERVKSRYSSMDRMSHNWLMVFLFSVTIVTVAGIGMEGVDNEALSESWQVFAGLLTFVTAIYGFLNPGFFSGDLGEERESETAPVAGRSGAKYAKSALSPEKAIDIERRILAEIEKGKSFLDPELSLYDFAGRLGVSSHALSQVLNDRMKMTFYDFINLHRIEEAKRLLHHPAKVGDKVVAIAFDSGFNSLSTFNALFRKYTGMTPSEFRKKAYDPIG